MSRCHGPIQIGKREKNTARVFPLKRKAREREENERYLAFIKEKEALAHQIKEKKEAENAQKDAIFK